MKKTKFFKLFSMFGLTLILFSIVFTLSSKASGDDLIPPEQTPCGELTGINGQIKIEVDIFNDTYSTFRKTGFEQYIPQDDLRNDASNPAGFITETDKYYCIVTVTSPQCADWIWEAALSNDNRSNQNTMDILFPPDGYDARIDIYYYEIADFFTTPIDFNEDSPFQPEGVRVIYEGGGTYPSAGTVPIPIQLFAVDTDFQGIDIGCDFCGDDIPWGGGKGLVGDVLGDYEGINQLIQNRN